MLCILNCTNHSIKECINIFYLCCIFYTLIVYKDKSFGEYINLKMCAINVNSATNSQHNIVLDCRMVCITDTITGKTIYASSFKCINLQFVLCN